MAEMLPLSQAKTVTKNLLDYLGTTFALADPDTRRVLDAFLQDPATGIFRGPYVRVRLPPLRPPGPRIRAAVHLPSRRPTARADAGDHRHRFR